MSWTLGGVRIYAQSYDEKDGNIIARLQPISGGTTLHHFGYEDEILSIGGLVLTEADKNTLKAMAKTQTSYSLVSPEITVGDYFVKNFTAQRTSTTNLTYFDRPGLDCDTPEYDVSMELYIDN